MEIEDVANYCKREIKKCGDRSVREPENSQLYRDLTFVAAGYWNVLAYIENGLVE
jgi:hypothetical protein